MRKSMIYLVWFCWVMGFLFSLIPGITYFILFSVPLYMGMIIVAKDSDNKKEEKGVR